MKLSSGELFAGCGGLALAVEAVLGASTRWMCEIDAYAASTLRYNFPDVTLYSDISTTDWGSVPKVDIISGGSPCQDVSSASRKNRGMFRGNRSGLWYEMERVISIVQPKLVVWENVRGVTSAGTDGGKSAIEEVLHGLSNLGYDAQWRTVRASDTGAPHKRERGFLSSRGKGIPTPTASDGSRGGKNPYRGHRSALLLNDYAVAVSQGLPCTREELDCSVKPVDVFKIGLIL